jgi:hypothetical protein
MTTTIDDSGGKANLPVVIVVTQGGKDPLGLKASPALLPAGSPRAAVFNAPNNYGSRYVNNGLADLQFAYTFGDNLKNILINVTGRTPFLVYNDVHQFFFDVTKPWNNPHQTYSLFGDPAHTPLANDFAGPGNMLQKAYEDFHDKLFGSNQLLQRLQKQYGYALVLFVSAHEINNEIHLVTSQHYPASFQNGADGIFNSFAAAVQALVRGPLIGGLNINPLATDFADFEPGLRGTNPTFFDNIFFVDMRMPYDMLHTRTTRADNLCQALADSISESLESMHLLYSKEHGYSIEGRVILGDICGKRFNPKDSSGPALYGYNGQDLEPARDVRVELCRLVERKWIYPTQNLKPFLVDLLDEIGLKDYAAYPVTDASGKVRYEETNGEGKFRFGNLRQGDEYILKVSMQGRDYLHITPKRLVKRSKFAGVLPAEKTFNRAGSPDIFNALLSSRYHRKYGRTMAAFATFMREWTAIHDKPEGYPPFPIYLGTDPTNPILNHVMEKNVIIDLYGIGDADAVRKEVEENKKSKGTVYKYQWWRFNSEEKYSEVEKNGHSPDSIVAANRGNALPAFGMNLSGVEETVAKVEFILDKAPDIPVPEPQVLALGACIKGKEANGQWKWVKCLSKIPPVTYTLKGRIINGDATQASGTPDNLPGSELINPKLATVTGLPIVGGSLKVKDDGGNDVAYSNFKRSGPDNSFFSLEVPGPGKYTVAYDNQNHTDNPAVHIYGRGGQSQPANPPPPQIIELTQNVSGHENIVVDVRGTFSKKITVRIIQGSLALAAGFGPRATGREIYQHRATNIAFPAIDISLLKVKDGAGNIHGTPRALPGEPGCFVIEFLPSQNDFVVEYDGHYHKDPAVYNRGGDTPVQRYDKKADTIDLSGNNKEHLHVIIDAEEHKPKYKIKGRVIDGEGTLANGMSVNRNGMQINAASVGNTNSQVKIVPGLSESDITLINGATGATVKIADQYWPDGKFEFRDIEVGNDYYIVVNHDGSFHHDFMPARFNRGGDTPNQLPANVKRIALTHEDHINVVIDITGIVNRRITLRIIDGNLTAAAGIPINVDGVSLFSSGKNIYPGAIDTALIHVRDVLGHTYGTLASQGNGRFSITDLPPRNDLIVEYNGKSHNDKTASPFNRGGDTPMQRYDQVGVIDLAAANDHLNVIIDAADYKPKYTISGRIIDGDATQNVNHLPANLTGSQINYLNVGTSNTEVQLVPGISDLTDIKLRVGTIYEPGVNAHYEPTDGTFEITNVDAKNDYEVVVFYRGRPYSHFVPRARYHRGGDSPDQNRARLSKINIIDANHTGVVVDIPGVRITTPMIRTRIENPDGIRLDNATTLEGNPTGANLPKGLADHVTLQAAAYFDTGIRAVTGSLQMFSINNAAGRSIRIKQYSINGGALQDNSHNVSFNFPVPAPNVSGNVDVVIVVEESTATNYPVRTRVNHPRTLNIDNDTELRGNPTGANLPKGLADHETAQGRSYFDTGITAVAGASQTFELHKISGTKNLKVASYSLNGGGSHSVHNVSFNIPALAPNRSGTIDIDITLEEDVTDYPLRTRITAARGFVFDDDTLLESNPTGPNLPKGLNEHVTAQKRDYFDTGLKVNIGDRQELSLNRVAGARDLQVKRFRVNDGTRAGSWQNGPAVDFTIPSPTRAGNIDVELEIEEKAAPDYKIKGRIISENKAVALSLDEKTITGKELNEPKLAVGIAIDVSKLTLVKADTAAKRWVPVTVPPRVSGRDNSYFEYDLSSEGHYVVRYDSEVHVGGKSLFNRGGNPDNENPPPSSIIALSAADSVEENVVVAIKEKEDEKVSFIVETYDELGHEIKGISLGMKLKRDKSPAPLFGDSPFTYVEKDGKSLAFESVSLRDKTFEIVKVEPEIPAGGLKIDRPNFVIKVILKRRIEKAKLKVIIIQANPVNIAVPFVIIPSPNATPSHISIENANINVPQTININTGNVMFEFQNLVKNNILIDKFEFAGAEVKHGADGKYIFTVEEDAEVKITISQHDKASLEISLVTPMDGKNPKDWTAAERVMWNILQNKLGVQLADSHNKLVTWKTVKEIISKSPWVIDDKVKAGVKYISRIIYTDDTIFLAKAEFNSAELALSQDVLSTTIFELANGKNTLKLFLMLKDLEQPRVIEVKPTSFSNSSKLEQDDKGRTFRSLTHNKENKEDLDFEIRSTPGGDGKSVYLLHLTALYKDGNSVSYKPFTDEMMKKWKFILKGQVTQRENSDVKRVGRVWMDYKKDGMPALRGYIYASAHTSVAHVQYTPQEGVQSIIISLAVYYQSCRPGALPEDKGELENTLMHSYKTSGTGYYVINYSDFKAQTKEEKEPEKDLKDEKAVKDNVAALITSMQTSYRKELANKELVRKEFKGQIPDDFISFNRSLFREIEEHRKAQQRYEQVNLLNTLNHHGYLYIYVALIRDYCTKAFNILGRAALPEANPKYAELMSAKQQSKVILNNITVLLSYKKFMGGFVITKDNMNTLNDLLEKIIRDFELLYSYMNKLVA